MVKEAPRPRDLLPSKFLLECLEAIPASARGVAIDFGCAYGRHVFAVAGLGYFTIGLDFDPRAIASLAGTAVHPIRCDLDEGIPVRAASASLVIGTEYPKVGAIRDMAALVKPNGYLIFETFSAKGNNWIALPEPGAIRSALKDEFEVLRYSEGLTGANKGNRCTVKLFAIRIQTPAPSGSHPDGT